MEENMRCTGVGEKHSHNGPLLDQMNGGEDSSAGVTMKQGHNGPPLDQQARSKEEKSFSEGRKWPLS